MCILYCCEGRKLDNYWVITSPSLNKEYCIVLYEGWGLLGMWPGIELVGKESVCKVALFRLKYNYIKTPWQPLITTEESKSSFTILKYISLLCKT